jgi:hypothetical protein
MTQRAPSSHSCVLFSLAFGIFVYSPALALPAITPEAVAEHYSRLHAAMFFLSGSGLESILAWLVVLTPYALVRLVDVLRCGLGRPVQLSADTGLLG